MVEHAGRALIAAWPLPALDTLRIAWISGKTPTQIAVALGPAFTRAAVLAKVDELDLDSLRLAAAVPIGISKPERRRTMQDPIAREARLNGVPFPERIVTPRGSKPLGTPREIRHDAGLTFDERALVAEGVLSADEIRALNQFRHIVPPPIGEISHMPPVLHALNHLRSRHCRFPIGDPGKPGFHFCCRPRGNARPDANGNIRPVFYCGEHADACYNSVPQRRSIVPRPKVSA